MKTPKDLMSKDKQKNSTKLGFLGKFLIFICLLFVGFTILPQVIIIGLGLLPTLTIVLTESKNINKITTVGCFNVTGVIVCLNSFIKQFNENIPFSMNENIANVVVMLISAAIGVCLYYIMPDIFALIFKNSAQHRLKTINAKLEKLKQNWANIVPDDN
ncbi:MAG: hypothetical protein MJ210_01725 [Alphaproteobacteria bacterium]|nr:hypothetical protein [Alphaproteobacteria bacterium]